MVVCCTSGSALLNLHPAVCEAFYRRVPLVVVSADRPAAWIGPVSYTHLDVYKRQVDHRTRQPFGILHGGATLALAETVAGLGSMVICNPDEFVVGMQVSGNHISSAHEGDTVRAVATIVHKGRSSHVWNVDRCV